MRFAGNQQHAQAILHSIDLHDSAVVGECQFPGAGFNRQFQDGQTAMVEGNFKSRINTDRNFMALSCRAVYQNSQRSRLKFVRFRDSTVLDADRHQKFFADNAVARCLKDDKAPISFVLFSCEKHVHGR